MEIKVESLGKVGITVEEDYWSSSKVYDKLTIVQVEGSASTYISRIPVPANTYLNNRKYWIPLSKNNNDLLEELRQYIDNAIGDIDLSEMQSQIDAINAYLFPFTFTASVNPSLIDKNSQTNVTFTFTSKVGSTNTKPDTLVIGGETISNPPAVYVKAVNNLSTTTSISATATYNGVSSTKSATVTAINPIKYGFLNEESLAASDISSLTGYRLSNSVATTYSTNNNTGNYCYFWIAIPSNMNITSIKSQGFDVPYESAVTVGEYKCYRTSNKLQTGSWNFVIS